MREYSALKLTPVPSGARVAHPEGPGRVTLDDPAFAVMTDLRNVPAATTTPGESIGKAHAQMIQRGPPALGSTPRGRSTARSHDDRGR